VTAVGETQSSAFGDPMLAGENATAAKRRSGGASLLRLQGIGKDYAKVETRGGRLRLVWDLLRGREAAHVFRALSDIGFEMHAGESLGVIGENGAGKSTLLKVIAGVIEPTHGTLQVSGRVGALLELGSGFHPEYTGLANIDLAAALLGLSPGEIADQRERIIEFADLGLHIHDPIKTYSSGMVVRLGFAIATALAPDILITDEVLAVGDESFQKKCMEWMEGFLDRGGTLLICSHSMYHVQKLCRHALWLKEGRMERYGPAIEVSQAYLAYHEAKSAKSKRARGAVAVPTVDVHAIRALEILPGETVPMGADVTVRGQVYSPDGTAPVILIGIVRADGTPVYGVASDMDGWTPVRIADDRYEFALQFPSLPLLPGSYVVRAHTLDPKGVYLFDHIELPMHVKGDGRELGFVRLPHRWTGGDLR
jgi:lipopolysaccharide transport system ATP-binding protein